MKTMFFAIALSVGIAPAVFAQSAAAPIKDLIYLTEENGKTLEEIEKQLRANPTQPDLRRILGTLTTMGTTLKNIESALGAVNGSLTAAKRPPMKFNIPEDYVSLDSQNFVFAKIEPGSSASFESRLRGDSLSKFRCTVFEPKVTPMYCFQLAQAICDAMTYAEMLSYQVAGDAGAHHGSLASVWCGD